MIDLSTLERTFSRSDLAGLAGVTPKTLQEHIDKGVIPGPSVQRGRRMRYTQAEAEAVLAHFAGRQKYDPVKSD